MTRDRLLEQAIELLAIADFHSLTLKEERNQVVREGIELLRQPKPEPVAWWDAKLGAFDEKHFDQLQPLYTAPPQSKPLTDDLYNELLFAVGNKCPNETRHQTALRYILQAEKGDEKAAHGIKGDA